MKTDNTIDLKEGRKLGYVEYGEKSGFPVMAFHGTPGSRIWFKEDDPIAKSLGIRLITIDRPGYGLSDAKPNRKIIDFNDDVDQLLDQLGIDSFSIFGVSGGGAYSLSYAASTDRGIFKAGLIASVAELLKKKVSSDMCKPNRIAIFLARRIPLLLRYSYNQQKNLLDNKPDIYIKAIQKNVSHLCELDQSLLRRNETLEAMVLQISEAFRINAHEAVNELKLLVSAWGINYSNIKCPIEVWHGMDDTLSPISGIKDMVKRIPNYHIHYLEGKGHFLDEEPEIWMKILKSLIK